jgi:hypothetical protein
LNNFFYFGKFTLYGLIVHVSPCNVVFIEEKMLKAVKRLDKLFNSNGLMTAFGAALRRVLSPLSVISVVVILVVISSR